jgi:hypothetical protein
VSQNFVTYLGQILNIIRVHDIIRPQVITGTPTIVINQDKCYVIVVRVIPVMHLLPGRQSISIRVLVIERRSFPFMVVVIIIIAIVNNHIIATDYITHRDLIT